MTELTTAQRVGEEVRVLMVRRRASAQVVAEVLGVSTQAIYRRLSGDVPFDVEEITKLAAHFGVAASTLLPDGEAAA